MKRVKIKIIVLGYLKHTINWARIISWRSDLFAVSFPSTIELLPNADGVEWDYSDDQLSGIVRSDKDHDVTVGIINATLEDNFYLRRLSENTCVLSLADTGEILKSNNLELENFIIRNLYEIFAVFEAFRHEIPPDVYSIAHDETRCCLFDMCPNKNDIVYSNQLVRLCEQCRTKLKEKGVSAETVKTIQNEVSRIRKRLFFRLRDFVVLHPLLSIFISLLVALLVNLVANAIFESFWT